MKQNCILATCSDNTLQVARHISRSLLSGFCLACSSGNSLLLATRHKMSQNCFLATVSEVSLQVANMQFCHNLFILAKMGEFSLVGPSRHKIHTQNTNYKTCHTNQSTIIITIAISITTILNFKMYITKIYVSNLISRH